MSPLAHALSIAGVVMAPWALLVVLACVLPPKKEKV